MRRTQEKMTDEITPITMSHIKDLRIRGHYGEASRLLKAFRDNNKKNKDLLRRKLRREDYRKIKAMGVCVYCRQRIAQEHTVGCKECMDKYSKGGTSD